MSRDPMQAKHSWISGALVTVVLLVAVIFSCSPGFAQNFTNQTATVAPGLADGWTKRAAWGDFNDDGYVDLLGGGGVWENVAGPGGSRLLNLVMSVESGVWADYDNDGKLDFYNIGTRQIVRNRSSGGNTSFNAMGFPTLPMHRSQGASWADYDNNGDVDLYVGGYEIFGSVPAYYDAVAHNNAGTFTYSSPADDYNFSPARGVTSADFDRDGDQDVYVSNYRLTANRLYQNDGSGSFTDVASTYNAQAGSGHSIGAAWGDFDNDGDFDIFAGNFAHNANHFGPGNPPVRQPESRFLENTITTPGTPTAFTDRGTGGVAWQESYATPTAGDYDNDGDLDLFFTTVYGGDNPRLYRNDGNWNFTNVTAAEGLSGLGQTYQAAWADFDNDGDLDLVTDGKMFVNNETQTNTNHWLKVKMVGNGTTINRAAIGSEVRINVGGQILTRQVEGGTGAGNQNDLTLHFGLGSYSGPVDFEINWPGGTSQTIYGVAVDQTVDSSGQTIGGGPIAGGSIIFEEDWESQAGMGEDPCNPPWESADNANDHLKVLTDTGNLFGAGTSNKYYLQNDFGGGGKSSHGFEIFGQDANNLVTLATVSMDFIEQSGASGTEEFDFNVMKAGATSNFGSDRVHQLRMQAGDIVGGDPNAAEYTKDTKHHMDWILNLTGATVNYNGESVADGTHDVWIDGVLKIDDQAHANATATDMGGLVFQSGNTTVHGDFLVDNIIVRDEAFVTSFAPACDFTGDNLCKIADIRVMMAQGDLVAGVPVGAGNQFDLNSNNIINQADLRQWLSLAGTENGYASPYLRGDTDGVGSIFPAPRTVDITDFDNFLNGFTGSCLNWRCGNFNGDNDVDITDFSNHFLPNFIMTGGGTYGPNQSIPEPSTLLLLGMGGLLLAYLCCRRSR